MVDNKKVINAKKIEYDNIIFDSRLELNCYKLLRENDLDFEYNAHTFELVPKYRMNNVHYFNSTKNRSFSCVVNKSGDKSIVQSMTYTPDFILKRDYMDIIIETKGWSNDVYPYKRKLLFSMYENSDLELYFFEPKNIKEIKLSIGEIKKLMYD